VPCMPHVVHKGIFFSQLDARYSKLVGTTPGERLQILNELKAVNGAGVRPPNLFIRIGTMRNAPAGPMTSDGRMKHLYEHWFGYTLVGSNWVEDWRGKTTTGWWSAWKGTPTRSTP
jgi:hypothetical protein